mmetsp:Transcript_57637/g.137056  ORF Transcript_57637/g.137056 Transcript_57637/m.137056 type:complete len:81 (-) Transcript_57637:174-416(-)
MSLSDEPEVYFIGYQAYVPRLVSANIDVKRPGMSQPFGTRPDYKVGKKPLSSLPMDVYDPSGLKARIGIVETQAGKPSGQ